MKNYVFYLVAVAVVLLPFQNCSLYQSPQRKLLEMGQITNGSSASVSCAFLSDVEARAIFQANTATSSLFDAKPEIKYTSCTVGVVGATAANLAVCSVSTDNYTLAQANPATAGYVAVYPKPGTMTVNGYGYLLQTASGSDTISFTYFVGAKTGSSTGVSCLFTFNNLTDFNSSSVGRDVAITRGFQIVESMAYRVP